MAVKKIKISVHPTVHVWINEMITAWSQTRPDWFHIGSQ